MGVPPVTRNGLPEWMDRASAQISGIPKIPAGGDACSLGRVLCCVSGEEMGFFGFMEDPIIMPASSTRVVPITDCRVSIGRVIVSFAGLLAIQNLSELPTPPELVAKLDLTSCTGFSFLLRSRIIVP